MSTDKPLMIADTPVKQLEMKALKAYREKYPAGPAWQELHPNTRFVWVAFAESKR